jgi:tripartite-type tricarboxylate transporter receptor subunit TctC
LACAGDAVKIVVPFAAGGPVDQVARILTPGLISALGKPVIIENRGGAGGTIGAAAVAKSAPDGLTLLLGSSGYVMSAGTVPNLPYDARKDLEPVAMVGEVQSLLVARNNLEAANILDLIAKAKAGMRVSYGSAGVGSTMHIGAELINFSAGTHFVHVPYRGAGPALTDLMAGTIDILNGDVPVLAPYVKDGRIRALVIYDTKRSPKLPDVPTNIEAGVPQLQMTNWYGFFVPAGTPPALRTQLENAVLAVVQSPEVATKLADNGMSKPMNAAAFRVRLNADFERWIPFLKKAGIKSE